MLLPARRLLCSVCDISDVKREVRLRTIALYVGQSIRYSELDKQLQVIEALGRSKASLNTIKQSKAIRGKTALCRDRFKDQNVRPHLCRGSRSIS